MQQKPFIEEMEQVYGDLDSGLAAFSLVYQVLSEKAPLDDCTESLFVLYTYLQGVHRELGQFIHAGYQRQVS